MKKGKTKHCRNKSGCDGSDGKAEGLGLKGLGFKP